MKGKVIKSNIQHLTESDLIFDEFGIASITCEMSDFDTKLFLSNPSLFPKVAMKARSRELFILGVGSCFHSDRDLDLLVEEGRSYSVFCHFPFEKEFEEEWKPFNDFAYIIPRIEVKVLEDNLKAYIHIYKDEDLKAVQKEVEKFFSHDFISERTDLSYQFLRSIPSEQEWCHGIENATQVMKGSELKKVVLASEFLWESSQKKQDLKLIDGFLASRFEEYGYLVLLSPEYGFLSLTPEKLFQIQDGKISMDVLAGTRPRGDKVKDDSLLENELLRDPKERHEHEFVRQDLETVLKEFCSQVTVTELSVKKLSNVQHLFQEVSGFCDRFPPLRDLVATLSPTPAVGGVPRKTATLWIHKKEEFVRGLYSSAIGVLTEGAAEFCVGLRSALVYKGKLALFGGAGIVVESVGSNEWKEVQTKLLRMKSVLEIL